MTEPRVIPREAHSLSRRDVDPDALKVLYRLRQANHIAYLVGGSVRDLLLGRRPKDFDIGTSAHPYEVKKLFRNCWIIGRRFRLAHVKFGQKVIEVATFRRQIQPGEEITADGVPAPILPHAAADDTLAGLDDAEQTRLNFDSADERADASAEGATDGGGPEVGQPAHDGPEPHRHARGDEHLLHRDNTFGTPEEDAFRRDFTINALFYDIATFSVIDYTGGLDDLRAGVIRCIGDPEVRFLEDPVRMLRAVAMAARLDFTIDQPILDAIALHRHAIARSSPPRLLEEYYKILRTGSAQKAFRSLASTGLLEPISTELHEGADEPLWQALANLDAYRRRFEAVPETFSTAVLLGTLLVPLGLAPQGGRPPRETPDGRKYRAPLPKLGELPLARRDVEHLRHLLSIQRRLRDIQASPRAQQALTQRPIFAEALAWLEIHGDAPELVAHWKGVMSEPAEGNVDGVAASDPPRRRRRRRRRRPFRGETRN